jgi:hypothetical protein
LSAPEQHSRVSYRAEQTHRRSVDGVRLGCLTLVPLILTCPCVLWLCFCFNATVSVAVSASFGLAVSLVVVLVSCVYILRVGVLCGSCFVSLLSFIPLLTRCRCLCHCQCPSSSLVFAVPCRLLRFLSTALPFVLTVLAVCCGLPRSWAVGCICFF